MGLKKDKYYTSWQRLIMEETEDHIQKTEEKKVGVFFEALQQLLEEKKGGVYLTEFGYFCNIETPKRIYINHTGEFKKLKFPYLFTDLGKRYLKNWTMFSTFSKETDTSKNYKVYYKLIKEYKKRYEFRGVYSGD